MANHYRILNVVFSKERQAVESFLDGLKSGGWGGQAAIPVPHEGECGLLNNADAETPVCGRCERQAWGSLLFPDIRILTSEGVSEIDDCRHLSGFARDNPFAQASAVISGASYAGFARPERH